MNFSFAQAIQDLGPDAAFKVANAARPAGDYLFNSILPERSVPSYYVKSGSMRVVGTMAGMVGMDSPYPPGGLVTISQFLEQTAKLANEVVLPEQSIRELQTLWYTLTSSQNPNPNFLAQEALNFLQKLVIQPHLDRMEWLRGQALAIGSIDWTFSGINLLVDYGIPAANILTQRTDAANTAYFDTASSFWTDVKEARRILGNNIRYIIGGPAIVDDIVSNSVNNIQVVAQNLNSWVIRKLVERPAGTLVPSDDARDTISLQVYDKEAEVLNTSTPGATTKVKFMPEGKLLFIGSAPYQGYRVGQGATPDPEDDTALGYTHIAPTVEGKGAAGRWADIFTPEREPWSLHARGVTNGLPVIENPDVIVIARSEVSA